jgi:hypothetical protein
MIGRTVPKSPRRRVTGSNHRALRWKTRFLTLLTRYEAPANAQTLRQESRTWLTVGKRLLARDQPGGLTRPSRLSQPEPHTVFTAPVRRGDSGPKTPHRAPLPVWTVGETVSPLSELVSD